VLLSYLIQEFGDNRSITSVVPLDNPAAADEPDLLALSPEQAEETQLCAPLFVHAQALERAMPDWPCKAARAVPDMAEQSSRALFRLVIVVAVAALQSEQGCAGAATRAKQQMQNHAYVWPTPRKPMSCH
jgi:hypothetical protein